MLAETLTPDLRFLLLPLPGFAMLPFGGFLDKLRFTGDEEDYSRQRYCTWSVLGVEAGEVESSSGAAVRVDLTPEQIRLIDYDYLVVFGGRSASATEALAPRYGELLQEAATQRVKLVSIDNACFLLAAWGLLEGHKVVVHWRHESEFRASYPRIPVVSEQLYCIDGSRISCAGGLAAIDLAVELLARACGRTRAMKGLADMLVDESRSSQHQVRSREDVAAAGRHVGRAIALMRHWMASGKTMEDMAERVGISRRQLDRLFQAAYGMTASDYWSDMRLRHVEWRLLNSSHSLALIADEVGMADPGYLAKVFRKRFGVTPAALRKAARPAQGGR